MMNMKKVEKIILSTNDSRHFNRELTNLSGSGYSIVPGTMHVSSHERTADSEFERSQQKEGCRFFRETFIVQMEREVEIPEEQKPLQQIPPKDTDYNHTQFP